MRRAPSVLLLPLAASLLLAGCGDDSRYKAALDQVAHQAREAQAQRERADALAGRVEHLEKRVAEAERARRALSAEAAAERARAAAQAATRARLESELDEAIADAHRAQARLMELRPDEAAPWLDPSGPVGAHALLLRSAGLCVRPPEPEPALAGGGGPAQGR
jgi:hypothetical protein